MDLSKEELDLIRQWYNAVQDTSPKYLEEKDKILMDKINTVLRNQFTCPECFKKVLPKQLSPSQQKFRNMIDKPESKVDANYMNDLLKKYGRNR